MVKEEKKSSTDEKTWSNLFIRRSEGSWTHT